MVRTMQGVLERWREGWVNCVVGSGCARLAVKLSPGVKRGVGGVSRYQQLLSWLGRLVPLEHDVIRVSKVIGGQCYNAIDGQYCWMHLLFNTYTIFLSRGPQGSAMQCLATPDSWR